jgi:translation elongation factor EF-Tu-like GTPase
MKKGELIIEIEDVFYITGRGTVVTGQVMCEYIDVDTPVIIDPEFLPEFESKISGIESFRKIIKSARLYENIGLVLDGVEKKQVKKKMKIYKSLV